MRLPEVAVASASHSSYASPARNSNNTRFLRPSAGTLLPPSATDGGSGGWTLPPLNHFMTLPRRFMPSSFGASIDSSTASSPGSSGTEIDNRNRIRNTLGSTANGAAMDNLLNDEDEDQGTRNHFVVPRTVHLQDDQDLNDTDTGPVHQPEEIDLTVSSDEGENGGHDAADSGDIIEILDSSGVYQPAPLPRKRRRSGANRVLELKRQRVTDTRSAESTNISIQNSEVVEEFKRRLKCSICLDVLEDMTSTLCGHIFCAGCIHQAIRASGKCPLCQRHLHLKDTHRLFF
ncbi:hypothetical protein, variant 4 [Phytophthora nicotianae CJ01A1]|uniref:RING-type domain-containing protein n=5 Tax=Phytophthora nicotianae TaxID=4792 RepID=W2YEQ9_PHYNI|nr:hypothetical protein PPTG_17132 [Phytophthora nicotianae INRA-310]XP_008913023.1 hypothetical protein, variant 1 [Phytophthora nicotianae INRA-310]XP_008913024.1 hypothetical protein, variant 2 [Phytophthora nicotianae INRA-310]XP_008913025.1 hypothetical protein, variant 3 [Phytophthora nicotianae INRA-310]XP_008913026.1 hypothetical protein, variant 4 [Phytophthora nicotianae INRA-310]ETK75555.1 hypothetical protein L915_17862 [Phytophthora nicotianae]ETO64038.1 hypothetical protein F444